MKKRAVVRIVLLSCVVGAGVLACATLPEPTVKKYSYPKNAFTGDVQRQYTVLGPVRSKVDYISLDSVHEEKDLCKNYYNKAVRELLDFAKKQGGDAVIDVETVVFLADGRRETYKTPECSDDGAEGQVLAQGIAVKWKSGGVGLGSWTAPRQPATPATPRTPAALPAKHFVPQAAQVPATRAPSVTPPSMPLSPVILYDSPSSDKGYESVPMSATQPLEKPAGEPETHDAIEQGDEPAQLPERGEPSLPRSTNFADPRMGPVLR